MRVRFRTRRLSELYTQQRGARKYPAAVVTAFFEVMAIIEAATDERDLRALKSLHFEKLKGARSGQRSVRLHGGFRLTFSLEEGPTEPSATILDIEDYHEGA